MKKLRNLFGAWLRNESGSTTVEFVLWVPVSMASLVLIVDASLMLMEQTHMWRVASETSRQVSVGALTIADAPAYAKARALNNHDYLAEVTSNGSDASTVISVPFSEVGISGAFDVFTGSSTMTVKVTNQLEPGVVVISSGMM